MTPTTGTPPTTPPRPGGSRSRRDTRGILWFLTLAFLGAWIPWALVGLSGHSMDDPVIQLATAAFVPALAAIVVRRWITREGFTDAGNRLRLRQSWPYYLLAVMLPMVVLVLAVVLAVATGAATVSVGAGEILFLLAAPLVIVVAAPIFWGEEFGWTAYLRDRLVPGRPVATTFATGVVWGIWHWPLPWVGYFGGGLSPTAALVSMVLWIPLSVLLEFLIGWLWMRSGSVWPPAMMHAGSNLVVAMGIGYVLTQSGVDDTEAGAMTLSTLLMCAAMLPVVLVIIGTHRMRTPLPPVPPVAVRDSGAPSTLGS